MSTQSESRTPTKKTTGDNQPPPQAPTKANRNSAAKSSSNDPEHDQKTKKVAKKLFSKDDSDAMVVDDSEDKSSKSDAVTSLPSDKDGASNTNKEAMVAVGTHKKAGHLFGSPQRKGSPPMNNKRLKKIPFDFKDKSATGLFSQYTRLIGRKVTSEPTLYPCPDIKKKYDSIRRLTSLEEEVRLKEDALKHPDKFIYPSDDTKRRLLASIVTGRNMEGDVVSKTCMQRKACISFKSIRNDLLRAELFHKISSIYIGINPYSKAVNTAVTRNLAEYLNDRTWGDVSTGIEEDEDFSVRLKREYAGNINNVPVMTVIQWIITLYAVEEQEKFPRTSGLPKEFFTSSSKKKGEGEDDDDDEGESEEEATVKKSKHKKSSSAHANKKKRKLAEESSENQKKKVSTATEKNKSTQKKSTGSAAVNTNKSQKSKPSIAKSDVMSGSDGGEESEKVAKPDKKRVKVRNMPSDDEDETTKVVRNNIKKKNTPIIVTGRTFKKSPSMPPPSSQARIKQATSSNAKTHVAPSNAQAGAIKGKRPGSLTPVYRQKVDSNQAKPKNGDISSSDDDDANEYKATSSGSEGGSDEDDDNVSLSISDEESGGGSDDS